MIENVFIKYKDSYLINNLIAASKIARRAHKGQFDKAGQPYLQHSETVSKTVGEIVSSWPNTSEDFAVKALIVGYLHDVLEDSDQTIEDLYKKLVPVDCIRAIEAITKINGENYDVYLAKVKHSKLAALVKIADMTHNSDLSRLNIVTEKDLSRREKYQKAIAYLSEFTCEKCGKTFSLSKMGGKATRKNQIFCEDCLTEYDISYPEKTRSLARNGLLNMKLAMINMGVGSMLNCNKEYSYFLVPKLYGIGWTFNFGNPLSWFSVLGITGFLVFRVFFKRVKHLCRIGVCKQGDNEKTETEMQNPEI